jgi:tetratricopeptide (TPR) repeat protein
MNEKKRLGKIIAQMTVVVFLWTIFSSCSMMNENWVNHAFWSSKKQGVVMDEKAVNHFVSNMRTRPGNPNSHYLLANYYQERGKHMEALREFDKVLSIDPYYVRAYNGKGISYDRLGEHAKATESFRTALSLDPKLDYVLNNLCYSLTLQGNHEAAIEACKEALLLNKGNSRIRNNLALAYAMGGNYDQAYKELEIAANGDKVSAHLKLAAICYEKAMFRKAAEHYNLALLLNPSSDAAKKGLEASQELLQIAAAADQHQKTEAVVAQQEVALTRQAVQAAPVLDDAKAMIHLQSAQTLYQKGAFKEAQEQYQQAVALNPAQMEARKGVIASEALARIAATPSQNKMIAKASAAELKKVLAGKSLKDVGIEICNGNGQRHMARDISAYLKSRGFNVVRLTNARSFNNEGGGVIYYENDYKDAAVKVAKKMQRIKKIQPIDDLGRPQVNVKVLLGKDLVPYRLAYRN